MNQIDKITRRSFIYSAGLVSGGLILGCKSSFSSDRIPPLSAFKGNILTPNLFIQLKDNGELILVASRSEMGQGVRTSLTSIIADEMDAEWSYVQVKQAVGDSKYGNQNTDGSRSIRTLYETMRMMGATAKEMLITAAAKKWNIETTGLKTASHYVINPDNGEKLFYGDLVEEAALLEIPKNPSLKDPKDFKYIGKGLKSIDVADFTSGKAKYGMDIRIPNMKYACIARCPVTFGKVKSYDKTNALKIKGVMKIIEIPRIEKPFGVLGGIAVIATNTWAAIQGKEALNIVWEQGKNQNYNSAEYLKTLTKNIHKTGQEISTKGNINQAFKEADQIVESTFALPHLVHAPMEVPNATAWVKDDGTCEVWAPTQTPQSARKEVADYLEKDEKDITINVTFLGGGFGRKSKPDYVVEAVAISNAIQEPVQLIWTREDDIQHSYYHAVSAQYMKASIDKNGQVTGWLHRAALTSIMSTFGDDSGYPAGWELDGIVNHPYEIEHVTCEKGKAPSHIRIGWLRSVINIIHGFSINIFVDELAIKAGKDRLQFRLDLIGKDRVTESESGHHFDSTKLKNVLKRVAQNAGFGKELPAGHGMGIAMQYSFYTYVASVVELSVIDGKVKVHTIHSVIDCGTAVNVDTIESQMQGAAIFGMSLAYYGKITAKDGAIEQSNFHDYQMLRMDESPDIHVEIVKSNDKPTGVGEPGVPPIAPAIMNAIFDATGKRYYSLPLKDHGLV